MRLARRFLAYILVGIFAVLAAYGILTFRREVASFDLDSRRDQEALARVIEPAFSRVWQLDGRREALRLLERVNARETSVRASFWSAEALGEAGRRPGPLGEKGLYQVEREGSRHESYLVTYVPTQAGRGGFIELKESTRPRSEYVRESMKWAALAGFGIFAWSSIMAIFLGVVLIGRPIRALVEQARAIGAGELGVHARVDRTDELGELGREMNRMADRLEAGRKRLAAETTERLQALNQLRHADRLATVGKLASGVAHELGTPLNVVMGRAKMIRTREELPVDARQNAEIVEEQVARMSRIIRQLLDFARAGEGARQSVDLVEVTEVVQAMLTPMAEKRGVSLILDAPRDLPSVEGDSSQLEQVLTNLVVNAIQAMSRAGRVTIRLRTRSVQPPEAGEVAEHLAIEVIDEGIGMPAHIAARVFEPFFTTKGVGEGTGLGLSVAYGMVQDHGGFMRVESTPGHGSHFSIFLPLVTPAQGDTLGAT